MLRRKIKVGPITEGHPATKAWQGGWLRTPPGLRATSQRSVARTQLTGRSTPPDHGTHLVAIQGIRRGLKKRKPIRARLTKGQTILRAVHPELTRETQPSRAAGPQAR